MLSDDKLRNIAFYAGRLGQSGWLDNTDTLVMAGNGEVFFSKAYRSLLYDHIGERRKSIQILSNGTLFSEDEFQHLKQIYEEISVSISVDSMRKEMYERL